MNCQVCPSQPRLKTIFTVPVFASKTARFRVYKCVGCETQVETVEIRADDITGEDPVRALKGALNAGRRKRYLFFNQ